ncbi:sigma-54-dependent Fis family transcriptional regulator [Pseudacidovorax intermedius]|uniref:Fis family transcriptional regulator n=1 Tax=Pseudacidovorax intermedius TaxID=433924 RepID=A0A147GYM9_9BURK|nr:sigma-54-dependent Fis family transcriptional regulator [Pseudacidovorax intermedius]KTT22824.1 Fis family transcriptional regulator [Pseudacidovorax intermedius]
MNEGKQKRTPAPARISLAALNQAGSGTAGGPGWRIDLREVDAASHPTVADLSECLFFSPGDGRIWLQDQRMVLMHAQALGSLRRELIETIGLDAARGVLTRTGYLSGVRDAELVRRQWPDADPGVAAVAGTRLHALEGMVKVEVVHVRYDADTGRYDGEFLWHNASEDDEHIAAYGITGAPACWMQTGYATGYVSTLFGRLVLFREVGCRSAGDAQCRVVGRSVEHWAEDVQDDLRYLQLGGTQAGAGAAGPVADPFVPEAAAPRAAALEEGASATGSQPAGPAQGAQPSSTAAEAPVGAAGAESALVGASSAFNAAIHMVRRVAPTQATVLFTGESGVGKEMFARALHRASPRAGRSYVAVNCAALPETLIEAELFGVERGAYTGAGASRPGRFERADRGTLFLDEIGTLSPTAQGKLLRALQEGEIERVGGTRTLALDVRVVAATNVDLREAVRAGQFRADLFYRLNVFPIHLPPLRQRRDDIPLLMQHFLAHYRERHRRDVPGFTQRAVKALFNYGWPGNIRELQNLIERAVIMVNDGEPVDVHHLFRGGETLADGVLSLAAGDAPSGSRLTGGWPTPSAPAEPGGTLPQAEAALMADALRRTGGNAAAAARLLGITRATLLYRASRHGLAVGRAAR